jgi:hypothetical protein
MASEPSEFQRRLCMADKSTTPEIVYGGTAISEEISEPKLRKVYYRLEQGHVEGAFKAGSTWALNVQAYRRSVGLDPK